MAKRIAGSGPSRSSKQRTKINVLSGELVSTSLKPNGHTAPEVSVTAYKKAPKPPARNTDVRKAAVESKLAQRAAKKGSATTKTAANVPLAKKDLAARSTGKPVRKAVLPSSLGTARATAGKKVLGATIIEQVDGWSVVDVIDGIAVHDSNFKSVHYLNHTAAAMYLLCKEPINLQVMSTILREEFSLDRDPGAEIEGTVEEMIRIGLIRKNG